MVLSTICFAQEKIVLSGRVGYASTPVLKFNSFTIVVNDTLTKVSKYHQEKFEEAVEIGKKDTTQLKNAFTIFHKQKRTEEILENDSNLYFQTKENGLFKLSVNVNDSLFFKSPTCVTQRFSVKDLIKLDSIDIKLMPQKCVTYEKCNDTAKKLSVFIGEKIEVKRINELLCENIIAFDSKFEATYKLVKNIYGKLNTDTVKFVAFDHYGIPAFSEYRYVLLFVSEHCGKLYHEKYQYFDVYETEEGNWARPGDPYMLDANIKIKTAKVTEIKFKKSVVFERSNYYPWELTKKFNKPYFKFEGNKIFPVAGAYVEDLLEIKKQGVLKARGYKFD